jgi:type I restriction enzyme S subunit
MEVLQDKFKDTKIGRIPKDWEVVRFGELIKSNCYGPRFSAKDYLDTGNVKTIRGTDINKKGDILYSQVPVAQLPDKLVNAHKLKDGDLVMITTADCGLTGVYFDDGFPYIPSAYAVRLTLNQKALPLYFKYVFQTNLSKKQVTKYIRKGTVANLPGSDILKFEFAHPSLSEQQKIAAILSEADAKIEKEQTQKKQLEQLKKGLMQQLLTGKKRVKV